MTTFASDSSEYPSHADERRAFISGFNGSAGDAYMAGLLVIDSDLEMTSQVAP